MEDIYDVFRRCLQNLDENPDMEDIYDVYRRCLQNLDENPNADRNKRNKIWRPLRDRERQLIRDARTNQGNAPYELNRYVLFTVATTVIRHGEQWIQDETLTFTRCFGRSLVQNANAKVMDDFAAYCHGSRPAPYVHQKICETYAHQRIGEAYITIADEFYQQLVGDVANQFWERNEFLGLRAYIGGGLWREWIGRIKLAFIGYNYEDVDSEQNFWETLIEGENCSRTVKLQPNNEMYGYSPLNILKGVIRRLEGTKETLVNESISLCSSYAHPRIFWLDLCDYIDRGRI